ncbi:MAG: transcriptional repressor [Sulfurovum sp.]
MSDHTILLQNSELKATFQRINILENIAKFGHISIDDIYVEVIKIHPSLSLATVYKNIVLMIEKGILVEVPITGQKSKYEIKKENHIHLICNKCREVVDKPYSTITDDIFSNFTKEDNFSILKKQINLYGICSSC